MAILVPGGAGYIGSHTVDRLIENNFDVVVVDNLATGHRLSINKKAHFYNGDIRDKEFLNDVFEKESIDGVIHFAANSIVPESMEQPMKYFDNNVYGMINLLEVMNQHNVKNIVFSSTAAVYGEPKQIPIKETDAKEPTNPYGESKLMMEKMMHWADIAHDIKFTALRYFNVGGAKMDGSIGEDHHPETHLIPIILQVAQGVQDKLQIFGNDYPTKDGTNVRDYVHVLDLADAHILAMQRLLNGGDSQVFNLGSSTGFSNRQMLETARNITGKAIPAEDAPRRAGDPSTLVADSTKARDVLGWTPEHDNVKDIIASAWKWEQSHPNGYEN
ncbi:UDP-glucose 4-epimerase GalE [Apilactobacillus micheneri]|uniref:UDP-glucose 4-epimerase n=1 Tax=Apilactobacillus micheneri TaxID=1899430 RepID=A0A9Q8IN10_9LACO|nr:UDP-glucose 4-epimerase GalE [Apilactobacillus micheneri]TPR41043.1 UDP-glucose 4-epimerase GalE [Apilactobacillus micheneri]TPR42623.1 UDP-glucose 4-epimerase GalE [Apilactobacillus micheneri]TPR45591.1 UDP-glucose 4-epimerase GalE [Apilactobacillus micheneri]TPR46150.1 UDP-glucose 4-epimerase GalE [Apilactobacillus micheneri]TPR46835.1 UDP-glucose 4-epimerase GalE [Apilactobacillus micheneri]